MYAAGLKVFQKLEEGGGTNVPECKNTSVGNSVRFVTVGGGETRHKCAVVCVRLSAKTGRLGRGGESKMRQVSARHRKSVRSYKIKALASCS